MFTKNRPFFPKNPWPHGLNTWAPFAQRPILVSNTRLAFPPGLGDSYNHPVQAPACSRNLKFIWVKLGRTYLLQIVSYTVCTVYKHLKLNYYNLCHQTCPENIKYQGLQAQPRATGPVRLAAVAPASTRPALDVHVGEWPMEKDGYYPPKDGLSMLCINDYSIIHNCYEIYQIW